MEKVIRQKATNEKTGRQKKVISTEAMQVPSL